MAESEPSLLAQILGRITYEFYIMQPMIPTYLHLIASALFPIYAGAHASLSRPSSAAKPKSKKRKAATPDDDESAEEEEEHKMEGLAPSDAIMMPLLAGCTLAGLYFLIKWLQDPTLLNKILNAYFAIFGVFSVSRMITDVLDIGHSLIFPRRHAVGGTLYHVNGKEKKASPVASDAKGKQPILSPLPGFLSKIPLSAGFRQLLWSDRAMPSNKWTLRLYLHRVFAGKLKIGPHGLFGLMSALVAVVYFNFVDKPWYLTNLMGFGFSYGALQLMSPTTFATGSLILGALFFYDIYFVFYTPMMVTVAKSLDVPIKLMFPRPSTPEEPDTTPSHAMLGLGDVVLPGIMIGLALRFDLFLFYLRRQKRVPATEPGKADTIEKPRYFSLAGRWSDHFWTHSFRGRPLFSTTQSTDSSAPFTFPKIYFTASLIGYIVGILATLGVMQIWGHAQPALLYLVPGVLGSLWLTALVRGEMSLMWGFSEAVEEHEKASSEKEDGKQQKREKYREGIFSFSDQKGIEREERAKKAFRKHITVESDSGDHDGDANDEASSKRNRVKAVAGHRPDREVFSFSLEAPWELHHPRSIAKDQEKEDKDQPSPVEKGKPNWAPPPSEEVASEPAGKRIRLN